MAEKTASNGLRWWLLMGLYVCLTLLPSQAQQRRPATRARTSTARPKTTVKSKAQLERERRANLKRIKETSRILQQTQQKKQSTLGQLTALKEKITVQQAVIKTTSSELRYINTDVQQTEQQVQRKQSELERLKAEYAKLIYISSKTANAYNRLMFLFAADSFNEMLRRLSYVRQYSEARRQQVAAIQNVQQQLGVQLTTLNQKRQQKSQLLTTQVSENRSLESMREQQNQVVVQLSQQEEQLRRELAERQQAVAKLDELIAQRVREEIARAARAAAARAAAKAAAAKARAAAAARAERAATTEAERNSARREATEAAKEVEASEEATRTDRVALTPELAMLSNSFADNRGRLLWPVARGFVAQRFGRHPHPVLKNVTVENRGVDIQTAAGESVRAIFDGKVLTVANIAGMNNVVMIQHGEYFTVYAKLRTVSVSEGQQVKIRQSIGTVYTSPEGTSELQFQVWRNSTNLNPELWLGRR